jgi:hypothetical protein
MGGIMSKDNMALLKKYIVEYKSMPPDAFFYYTTLQLLAL